MYDGTVVISLFFAGIKHRLTREDAQDLWNKVGERGFKIAAADARITMQDDETGKCTSGSRGPFGRCLREMEGHRCGRR